MPEESLTERQKSILDLLKNKSYSYKELCKAVSAHTSPPTLRKELDYLVHIQLVDEQKGRRGQKHLYRSTKTLTQFEKEMKNFEALWNDLFRKLSHLENLVKEGKLDHQEAGSLLVKLFFEAVPLLPTTLDPSLPLELNERLLRFSAGKFRSYWEEIMRLGHESAEIRDGFQKGCEWLRGYVKPISEEIEEALGK